MNIYKELGTHFLIFLSKITQDLVAFKEGDYILKRLEQFR